MNQDKIAMLKAQLCLQPHPYEGGHYIRSYASSVMVALTRGEHNITRHAATSIYYLLETHEHSLFHILQSDEIWHFYQGDPMTIVEITPTGELITTTISNNFEQQQLPQYVVKAGNHFAAYIDAEHQQQQFSLVGCTVTPGFDFADFSISDKNTLLTLAPEHTELINRLT